MDIEAIDTENDKKVSQLANGKAQFFCLIPKELHERIKARRIKFDWIVLKGFEACTGQNQVNESIDDLKIQNEKLQKAIIRLQGHINELQIEKLENNNNIKRG